MRYVLVHGGAFAGDCWHPLLPFLDAAGIAPDLPGRRGRPLDHATIRIDDCARQVIADMDAAGIARGDLVGHSLGGATLLRIARIAPERVASLIFVAAPVPADGETILSAVGAPSQAFIGGADRRGDASLPLPAGTGALGEAASALGVREAVRLFLEPVELAGVATVPHVAYVRLIEDQSLPLALQDEAIAALRTQGRCAVIDVVADHMAMLSHPAALARALGQARRPVAGARA